MGFRFLLRQAWRAAHGDPRLEQRAADCGPRLRGRICLSVLVNRPGAMRRELVVPACVPPVRRGESVCGSGPESRPRRLGGAGQELLGGETNARLTPTDVYSPAHSTGAEGAGSGVPAGTLRGASGR